MTTKRHLTRTMNLLATIKERLILLRKQLIMIFKQTLTKIIVTKKLLLILTIIIPFYKLMLIIMKLLQKIRRNTKIKRILEKNPSVYCKRIYIIGDSILKLMKFLNHSKIAKHT